ncbi:MAG TPA: dihydroneopterin aldolase [Microscillaceae bacterium]|nr:dihydroneopterin aldolase [Microscillaceae bacterium]
MQFEGFMQVAIRLVNLEFYAYHGYFAEEQRIGNRYVVNLTVWQKSTPATQTDLLAETTDYGQLYRVVEAVMQSPTQLLEKLAFQIASDIVGQFQQIERVEVWVAKYNPPLNGLCEKAEIYLQYP